MTIVAAAAVPGPIARPRLAEFARNQVTLIVGSGGYGKSTLLRQLALAESFPALLVELRRPVTAAGLVLAFESVARADGLSDLAAVLSGPRDDVVEKLLGHLAASGGATLAVDEIDLLDDDAAGWLASWCTRLPEPSRVLLAGRHLPAALADLPGVGVIREVDLAFTQSEIERILVRDGHALGDPVRLLMELTGGWPAAVAVAAARRTAGLGVKPASGAPIIGLPSAADLADPLRALISLPLITEEIAVLISSRGFDGLLEAGVPITDRLDGWCEIPEPVRDRLGDGALLDPSDRRIVAARYAESGALPSAVSLLAGAGDGEGVAQLLADIPWADLTALGETELDVRLKVLPDAVVSTHPQTFLAALRATEWAGTSAARTSWLTRIVALTPAAHPYRPAVDAEHARQLGRLGRPAEAIAVADQVLDGATGDLRARGRALMAKAHAVTSGDRASQLPIGRQLFEQAAVHFRDAGERRWEAEAWAGLGYSIDFSVGAIGAAVEHLSKAVTLLEAADAQRAQTLTLLSEALVWLPDYPRAAAAAAEAEQIASRTLDDRTIAYSQWCWAWVNSRQGDGTATRTRITAAMQRRGEWSRQAVGVTMHAEFAALSADVGDEPGALHQLGLGRQLAEELGYSTPLRRAEAIVNAKEGDPQLGMKLLAALLDDPDTTPLYRWQYLLLAAWCADRRDVGGQYPTAHELAAEAIAAAEALGHPAVMEALEPELARWARQLTGAGSAGETVKVRLFGVLQIRRGQSDVPLPPGQAAELVAMLAASGPVAVDVVIDRLWADADRPTGRSRLRNLLNRLRSHSGDVVLREGQRLVLVPNAEVDLDRFTIAAEEARSARPEHRAGLARQALALLEWPMLPEFDADWLVTVRNSARRRAVALLDLIAEAAYTAGDLDDAARMWERAVELEPHDEVRYVRLAQLYRRQGRRGSARAVLRRAMAMVAEMGIPPSVPLASLVRELGRADPKT